MKNYYFNEALRSEYEKIRNLTSPPKHERSYEWQRFIAGVMPDEEREEFANQIDVSAQRALIDFEKYETTSQQISFFERAVLHDKRNIIIIGELLDESQIFILAVRRNSMAILNEGLRKLEYNSRKMDPREIVHSLSILYNCLIRLKQAPKKFFNAKAGTVNNYLKRFMLDFGTRDPEDVNLLTIGYKEVSNPHYGLIWKGE
ncbi:MAG: hypothetical protein AAFO07_04655 [Bacteroidota bacterium]